MVTDIFVSIYPQPSSRVLYFQRPIRIYGRFINAYHSETANGRAFVTALSSSI
jgi:hypothetical protein